MPLRKFHRERQAALLLGAFYAAWRGVRYLPFGESLDQLPAGLALLSGGLIPIGVWAALWIGAAAWCLVSAFRKDDITAWGGVCALMLVWGLAYVIGGFEVLGQGKDPGSSWTTATSYICTGAAIALLAVSPRHPKDEPTTEGGNA